MPSGTPIPVFVDGIEYPSIAAAARALGITKQALIQKRGMPGYSGQLRRKAAWDAAVVNGTKRSTDRWRKWKDEHEKAD